MNKICPLFLCLLFASISLAQSPSKFFYTTPLNESIHYADLHELSSWMKRTLLLDEDIDFKLRSTFTDKLGQTHFKFNQTYKGYDVQDGIAIVHTNENHVLSMNGEIKLDLTQNINIQITAEEAIQIGKSSFAGEIWAWDKKDHPRPKIYLISTEMHQYFAYKTDMYTYAPLQRKWLFVDVRTGVVIEERERISHFTVPGEAHCYYHGIQTIMVDSLSPTEFILKDGSRGDGITTLDLNGEGDFNLAVDFSDTDNIWDTTTDLDHAALDVHWATGLMFDYMLDNHGWNSYDNQGAAVNNYIHHVNNFNALWTGSEVVYGDGNGTTFTPFTSAEVVGHEFMHAYSTNMVDFNFSDTETRAINESLSDIFSVIVEFTISPSTANYILGDLITTSGEGIRSLEDPKSFDHPDTYLGQFWNEFDINGMAGVPNYCFYLLTQGGSGTNDNGDAYSIEAISMADAGDIIFRSLSTYMTPSVDMIDFRTHGIQACIDLYGPCSEQERQFTNACHAVGLGNAYVGPPLTEIQFEGELLVDGTIEFTSNTTDAVSWDWNFGDSNSSIEEMPTHMYETMGDYEVILSATYEGNCVMTDTSYVTIVGSSNVGNTAVPNFKVYPNPAQNIFFVEYSTPQNISKVSLLNTLGQKYEIANYKYITQNKIEIQANNLADGIYFLKLITAHNKTYYHTINIQAR
ncbi:M4 family metallopeptidase [Saprospiraceae bacterium]|nr:M4 family metallopeptidase [Saprospiraceae bacterium]